MLGFPMALTLAVHLGTVGLHASAEAPPPPPQGAITREPATKGVTEIGSQGKFTTAADPSLREGAGVTELELSLGGFASTGNARSVSVTGVGRFRLRRSIHQLRAESAANYGRAASDSYAEPETTVTNAQGLLRYDVFLHQHVSGFLQVTARHDTFQGLELRLNVDPGFAFYAINRAKHRLWFEAGYDFQYDIRTEDARIPLDPEGQPLDGDPDRVGYQPAPLRDETFVNHAARTFAGYSNTVNDRLTFDTGLEYLQSVVDGDVFRLNWASALSGQLAPRITLGMTFTLRYENRPVVLRRVDTISAVLLGIRIL